VSPSVPSLGPEQVAHFSRLTRDYIQSQREALAPSGQPIAAAHEQPLIPFFSIGLLRNVRVAQRVRVPNPPFYAELVKIGFTNLPSFTNMDAITFVDVLAFQVEVTTSTLFHELVHVVQYEQLGLVAFAERYVRGFLQSGSYRGIPLEVNAYQLQVRFASNPARPFSVQAEVESWIKGGGG
jgi:hypothetical protein